MLNNSLLDRRPPVLPERQNGVVLLIALIVLAVMTLTAIGLVRSVDTANLLAGNLAFQQSATHSGNVGTETAIKWLQENNSGSTLWSNDYSNGYSGSYQDPGAGQTWETFWNEVLLPAGQVRTLAKDTATGNTVAYTIQRLCLFAGSGADPAQPGTRCAVSPVSATSKGGSMGGNVVALLYSSQVYYRITVRTAGPRNTVSYVQSIVAM